MPALLINVGSNSLNPNGRGRIFDDFTFEYLPIPESETVRTQIPTYRSIDFTDVKEPDLLVHLDPAFSSFTYGHVRRGFGDIQNLLKLKKNDLLFFHVTLNNRNDWSTFIIGYFQIARICDCRKLSDEEIFELEDFADNAHLKRMRPSVDLLIKGGKGSKLLERAFPLSEHGEPLTLRHQLRGIVRTVTGKKVKSGAPWFRWILKCYDEKKLLNLIESELIADV